MLNRAAKTTLSFLFTWLAISSACPQPGSAEIGTEQGGAVRGPYKHITLLQVNDVYQVEPVDQGKRGGLARVETLHKQIVARQPNTLMLLAGDTLSPSVESRAFKGAQMIACWNAVGVDYAVFGNHEFDFGPDVLKQRIAESKFQWICANVIDKTTGKLFDNVQPYVIRDVDGIKIGIIGLLTMDTARSSHGGPNLEILDPCKTVKKLVPEMRAHGAQIIVALTHLTMADDKQVAYCAPIDVTVGGHEHVVMEAVAHGTPIIKSGSDVRNLGRIDISYSPSEQKIYSLDIDMIPVTDKIKDDEDVKAVINQYESQLGMRLLEQVGQTTVELDATQVDNQTKETNLADYIADAYRKYARADVSIFNGGSVRSNTVYPPGKLTRRDVLSILPFENPIVKLEVKGKVIRQALENGVSEIGIKAGGRFPQVSGLHFEYDATRKPSERIVSVLVGGQPLDDDKTYTLATNNFAAGGGDGYSVFTSQKFLITPEDGETEAAVFLNSLTSDKVISPQVDGRSKRLDASQ
ncbi:MAG TPA: bifunctional UDP-sugar hydrolase/5'-nucleotidase [Candidatus Obscuribacterales bacterium]